MRFASHLQQGEVTKAFTKTYEKKWRTHTFPTPPLFLGYSPSTRWFNASIDSLQTTCHYNANHFSAKYRCPCINKQLNKFTVAIFCCCLQRTSPLFVPCIGHFVTLSTCTESSVEDQIDELYEYKKYYTCIFICLINIAKGHTCAHVFFRSVKHVEIWNYKLTWGVCRNTWTSGRHEPYMSQSI